MDFPEFPSYVVLKPEEISDAIYSGRGSELLTEAANKWFVVARDLAEIARRLRSVQERLENAWQGESRSWMTETTFEHQTWLWGVAWPRTKWTAQVAEGIADAFDRVYASVVPPEDIAANRKKLQDAKTEIMINAPKVAALEEEYLGFWTQNAQAMDAYAREVRTQLSNLLPFSEAPQIVAPPAD